MTIPDSPPKGLGWTATSFGKGLTTLVALVALVIAIVAGVRTQLYINCVGAQQNADARRTAAISKATDAERAADRALIDGTGSRKADSAARAHTDAVRAANPPEPPGQC